MVEREMIKREITPLAVGFLIMISLFAYHWFNDDFKYAKNADRTIAKEEAELDKIRCQEPYIDNSARVR